MCVGSMKCKQLEQVGNFAFLMIPLNLCILYTKMRNFKFIYECDAIGLIFGMFFYDHH